jgi:hypothetical protein
LFHLRWDQIDSQPSPEDLTAEVGLLDSTTAPPPAPMKTGRGKRARKRQRAPMSDRERAKVVKFSNVLPG